MPLLQATFLMFWRASNEQLDNVVVRFPVLVKMAMTSVFQTVVFTQCMPRRKTKSCFFLVFVLKRARAFTILFDQVQPEFVVEERKHRSSSVSISHALAA